MGFIIEKEKVNNFICKYFRCLHVKRLLFSGILWILVNFIEEGTIDLLSLKIMIVVSLLAFFMMPGWLYKETKEYIEQFYSRDSNYDEGINDSIEMVCNLKKYDGPTFGRLYIDSKIIKFIPFKENLHYEKIVIDYREIKNIDISLVKIKSLSLNQILFKESLKAIKISWDSRKMLFQLPEPKYSIIKIKEKVNEI